MASVFAGIKQIDPVEGLVQYVLDIKPYHTKIIEVLVEYLHTDPLNVTILDELDWDIFLAEPARLQAEGCCDGYSVVNFGNPVVYPIASPNPLISSEAYPAINPINDSITMLTCGDPKVFTPGTQFRFFAFLEDYSNIHALINPSLALPADYDYTTPNCSVSTVTPYTYDYTITNCASGTSHDRVYDYIITSADQSVINTVNVSTTTRTTTNTFFDIFVNGLLQSEGTDYTVTGINQVTFLQSFQVGDVLVAIQNHFALYDYLTATIGQNIVNTINVTTQAFTNNLQYFSTYINGILQRENIDYTVTGANQITFAVPLVGGEELTFIESKSLGADNFIENLNPIFGQTIINTVLFPTVSRSPSIIYFDVYVNGLLQQEFVDYTVTGTNQVTFTSPFQGIEEIFFILLNYPDDNNVYDYVTSIAAQTVFNTVNVPTIARTVSSVFFDVYVNGLLKQEGIEYTVTGLNQITFTTPLVLGDRVTFIRLFNNFYDYETADVGQTVFNPVVGNNPYDYITAIAAQTIVNTTNVTTTTRTPVDTFFDVYVNGLLKQEGIEYTVTGLNQITFTTPLVLGDRLEFIQLLNNVYDYVTSIAAQTVFSTVNVTTVARNSYVSFFDVYVNGLLKQEGIEYTVTGLNQITFTTPLVLGDSVIFVSNNLSASNTYDYITGSGGQTIVNTTNVITTAKTVTLTFFEVFLNGILQLETDSYTVTGANQFTFLAALVGGDEIIINQITTPTILIPTIARTTNTFYFDVYVNGLLKQEGIEYTVTGLNQITFTSPLTGGDFVIFVANNTFVKNGYDYITGSGGQTIVNTTNVSTIPRSATMTFFEVFLNGILQLETDSYTVTGANQFTFLAALVGGDEIIINQIVMSSAPGCSQIVVSSVSTTARTATNAFVEVFLNGLLLTEGPEYIVTSTNTINVIPTLVLGDTFTFITALNGPYDYYTATGGETIVSTTNVSTITRTATQTTFDVYVGGILQREGVDYTVTGANQVTFTIPLVLNDLVIFISTTSGVILLYDYITAVAAQTTVNTTTVTTTPRTLINAFFDVYLNGILQDEGIDYTVTGLNQITFLLSLNFGDAVTFTSILTPSACQTDVDTVNVTTTARGISMVFFDAFRNGLLQREITDYTATGINEVTFTTTLSPGEDINFLERLDTQYEYFVSGVAQTIFNTAISTQAQTATTIFTTIYVDGNLQDESTDYTVTGANQVTFISPLSGGEKVTIHFNSIGILYDTFISGLAQTTFTTTNNINLTVRTASKIFFSVYVNGLYQEEGTDYNITMPDTIVFAVPLLVGYVVHVFANSNPIILFSPLNNFFVLGDQTTQFVPFYTFQVITPSGDSGTYTVTGAGSTFMFGITIIPVFQTIQHFSGIIGVEVTPGLQMIEGIGGTNLYTVKSCVFDNGRIPARSNPLDPFSLDQGINSHAIITTIEDILSPIPPLGPNQFYIMWITLVPFNIEEVIPYSNIFPQPANTPDESAFLDIGSNMFVIDGNRAATFHQGVQFDVINGDNAGAYTTLYSDFVFVTGKTRIRTLEGIAFTGIVPGQITLSRPGYSQHETSAQTTIIGFQLFSAMDIGAGVGQTIFNLTSLSVPGSDPALIRVTINGVPAAFTLNTAIQFTITSPLVRVNDLISATVYELPQPGASAFCGSIPPHELRVKFAEKLVFIGVGVATFFDDLIVYNLENTDLYSYELPTTTIFSATMPPVPMLPNDGDITPQPNPPFGGVLFDLWFDTTTNTFRQLQSTNTALTGQRWRGIITAYWFDTANNKFFKRTKNQFTDTGWFEDVFGGYNQVFPAVGETTVIDTQLFSTGPSAQTTFTLTTPVPGSDPSLLGVTIDDVPAGFTLNTATQFTITSPTPGINQIVVATVKDRILTERNAFVGTYNPIPHRIAHTSDFVAVDVANNAYILKGGNFVERFRYNSFEATNSIFGELGVWRHDSYPIVHVDDPTKTIFIRRDELGILFFGDSDLTNIFSTAGLVFQVVLSDNNKEWFTVVSSSYNAGTDETAIIVTQVVDETILFNAPLDPILQDFSRDLGVILGIIYDPIVNTTNPLDQVKTLVYTTTPVDATADGIEYTWIGPTHFDIGMNYTDLTGIATIDGFGVSNNLTGQPDSYNLICVNMTTDTFTIRRLDPILGIPVDLTDSFTPGTQFRITDSFNSINNFSLIIPENGPPGTPAQPTPPLLPAIGDYWYDTSTILLFTDITPVPDAQVAVIDILQANNTLEQFIVEGNFTTDFVAGFQFVVSNSGGNNGTYTTSSSVFGAFTPTTTTITVFENVSTNATTGVITRFGSSPATLRQWNGSRWNEVFVFNFPWTVMTATFNPGIDPCTGLIGVTTLEVIEDITDQTPVIGLIPQPYFGRIIREPLIVTERSGNTTATTIQDTLQFNWGQLQRYLIILTDQPNNAFIVNSVDILTNIILTNDRIDVIGTQGNDGEYNVVSVVNTGFNQYTITVQEIIPVQPLLETGVIQLDNLDITNWFQYLITDANATTNIFTLYGNATGDIQNGMEIRVLGTANNNGVYLVTIAPVFNGTHTLVPVNDILVDGQGGFIESVRDYGMRLLFRDTIGVATTEEATAAVVDTAGSLIGAWDFPYWDTGPFDESIPTVIHLYGNTFSP